MDGPRPRWRLLWLDSCLSNGRATHLPSSRRAAICVAHTLPPLVTPERSGGQLASLGDQLMINPSPFGLQASAHGLLSLRVGCDGLALCGPIDERRPAWSRARLVATGSGGSLQQQESGSGRNEGSLAGPAAWSPRTERESHRRRRRRWLSRAKETPRKGATGVEPPASEPAQDSQPRPTSSSTILAARTHTLLRSSSSSGLDAAPLGSTAAASPSAVSWSGRLARSVLLPACLPACPFELEGSDACPRTPGPGHPFLRRRPGSRARVASPSRSTEDTQTLIDSPLREQSSSRLARSSSNRDSLAAGNLSLAATDDREPLRLSGFPAFAPSSLPPRHPFLLSPSPGQRARQRSALPTRSETKPGLQRAWQFASASRPPHQPPSQLASHAAPCDPRPQVRSHGCERTAFQSRLGLRVQGLTPSCSSGAPRRLRLPGRRPSADQQAHAPAGRGRECDRRPRALTLT